MLTRKILSHSWYSSSFKLLGSQQTSIFFISLVLSQKQFKQFMIATNIL